MPSRALHEWLVTRRHALDEVEAAHRAVGGSGPGRRRATEQINHAKVVEDRGPLGKDGEHIFRVAFWFDMPGGPKETEIEASELTVVRGAA